MSTERTTCTVEDGKHVRACTWLEKATDGRGSGGRERGLRLFDFTNTKTHEPSRTFYAIKSEAFPKGLAIEFCPFCGTDISAPFKEAAKATPQGAADHGR